MGGVGNRNTKDRDVMCVIYRPIQRINIPNIFIIPLNNTGLFRKNVMIGEIPLHFAKKKFFRLMVYFCDKIDHSFIAHLMFFIIASTQNRACLARKILYIG